MPFNLNKKLQAVDFYRLFGAFEILVIINHFWREFISNLTFDRHCKYV